VSADAARARARRPFEPEHAAPDAAARARAGRFADRELDVLAEQGNFERARVLLARRAAAGVADGDAYLDAIRLERSASPAGAAWQAWAARAFAAGAEIAGVLAALVPERELCAYLIAQGVGWQALGRQHDRAAARALLRMRLEALLRVDPPAALAAIDEPALRAASVEDPALRVLVRAVIAGAIWDARDRAVAVAQSYAVETSAAAGTPDREETDASLVNAVRLQPAWITVTSVAESPCPAPLARFVRSGPVASRAALVVLAHELLHDLRAQPRAYLRCADAFARHAPELATWLVAECESARDALGAASDGAREAKIAADALARARGELRQRRLAQLVPWPLSRALDRRRYARAVRPVLLDAIAQHGARLPALGKALRAPGMLRGAALAVLAEGDRGLAIISELAAFAGAGGA
jgi:hypothetical protein